MRSIFEVPAALIMQVHAKQIEVLLASKNDDNPYAPGERADLGTGLYCETVMATQDLLEVRDALKDPKWAKNPDIELNMISYLGVPICKPNGEVFGTICVLDSKERVFAKHFHSLLQELKAIIESDFQMMEIKRSLEFTIKEKEQVQLALIRSNEILEEQVKERTRVLEDQNTRLQSLLEELHLLQYAVNQTKESVLITDHQGVITFVNPAVEEYYGFSKADLIGKNITSLLVQTEAADCTTQILPMIMSGSYWSGILCSFTSDGRTNYSEASISPVTISKDSPHWSVIVQHDVSERRANEKEKERLARVAQQLESDRTLANLAFGLSNELNNILHGIYIHSSALQMLSSGNTQIQHHTHRILKKGAQAHDLVSKLIILHGPQIEAHTAVDLVETIEELIPKINRELGKHLELEIELPKESLLVSCPKSSLISILEHLISNSQSAISPNNGTIQVFLDQYEQMPDMNEAMTSYARLRIHDDGVGMDNEILQRARDPFFTTGSRNHHMGLGLTLVDKIVQQLNGRLTLSSVPSEGTQVQILLPLAE